MGDIEKYKEEEEKKRGKKRERKKRGKKKEMVVIQEYPNPFTLWYMKMMFRLHK